MSEMVTADGVGFKLGMTLYLLDHEELEIREYRTSPEAHEIDRFEYKGRMVACLTRKGSKAGTEVSRFSATRSGAVAFAITKHRMIIEEHESAIRELEAIIFEGEQR